MSKNKIPFPDYYINLGYASAILDSWGEFIDIINETSNSIKWEDKISKIFWRG